MIFRQIKGNGYIRIVFIKTRSINFIRICIFNSIENIRSYRIKFRIEFSRIKSYPYINKFYRNRSSTIIINIQIIILQLTILPI